MLIGRDAERRRIEDLLQQARAGRSGALVLRGEPGIGKTALLDHAVERADGMTVVRALGVESEADLEFSGLLELARPLLGHLDRLPEAQADTLRGVLGFAPARDRDRFTIGAATLGLIAAAAEASPLLVVVDDAHWLDSASADALAFAVRRLVADRALVLFAAREGAARAFGDGIDSLVLSGLEPASAAELLAGRATPEVAARLHEATGGNPLALLELPGLLTHEQLLGAEPLAEPLPAGAAVEQAFARRAAALPEASRRALLVAAASLSPDEQAIGAGLTALGLDRAALDPAEDAGLVTIEGGRLAFRHPLVRSALFQAAAPSERRAAHHALAGSAADRGDAERRAWHLAAAAVGPDEGAADALADSAATARDRAAYAPAATAFERAARLTGRDDARRDHLLAAADSWWSAGRADPARTLLGEALDGATSPFVRARGLELRGRIEYMTGNLARAAETLLAAADAAGETDTLRAAIALAGASDAYLVAGHPAAAVTAGERARALAPRDGSHADFLAECTLGEALVVAGRTAKGVPLLERAFRLVEEQPALADDPRALVLAACAIRWLEQPGQGLDLARRAVALARERCAYAVLPHALEVFAWLCESSGRWDEAVDAASEAVERARYGGELTVVVHGLNHLALIGAARGEEVQTRAYVAEAAALAVEQGLMAEWAEHALAKLDLATGRVEEAVERLGAVERSLDERGGRWAFSGDYVEALVRLGRVEEAREAFARQPGPDASLAGRRAASLAARCRALLDDGDAWEALFADAIDLHREIEDVWGEAHTRLLLGERLRRAARRLDAREQLRLALATFERLRAEPWAERARAELRATGETIRRRTSWEEVELTPQELQIALRVARGMSNREVGAALYLSHKTVEFHLSRVYRKLGMRSRSELIRRFAGETAAPA